MAEVLVRGIRKSVYDSLSPDNQAFVRNGFRDAPRAYRAAETMPGQTPTPTASPMSVEQTRQLREWGLSREQIADLAELAPGDLARIWPTPAELEANQRMGPGGPGAVALIALKADQSRVALPPGWQGGTR